MISHITAKFDGHSHRGSGDVFSFSSDLTRLHDQKSRVL